MTVGTMLAFWFLLHKFFEPLRQISEKYNVLQSAMASADRLLRILDDDRAIADPETPAALLPALANRDWALEFDGVRFAYDGETAVGRDLNFRGRAGEKIAIVGHTGAGKSTIINLLGRFYDVTDGSIRLAGRDLREYDKAELRRAVGIVLQDVFLFSGSIADNISLERDDVSIDDVRRAASAVHATGFVDALPEVMDDAADATAGLQ